MNEVELFFARCNLLNTILVCHLISVTNTILMPLWFNPFEYMNIFQ